MRFLLPLLLCFATSVSRAETFIDDGALANNTSTAFVLIEGEIGPGLTDRFLRYIEERKVEGRQLFLNSPGGNLGEALRLGRAIRDLGWTTHVGSSAGLARNADGKFDMIMWPDYPAGGVCESACAYVFMGGLNRHMSPGAKLGFHRFRAPGQEVSGDAAQAISGQLISYIVEMGVDARVFVIASTEGSASMYHVSDAEAREYDLVTPSGFAPFYLEPYRDGIIAASKRADAIRDYDYVQQVTALCRGGQAQLLYSSGAYGLQPGDRAQYTAFVDGEETRLSEAAVTVRATESASFITVALPADLARAMTEAQRIDSHFGFARVSGGDYAVRLTPSALDRNMLASAFRFCID